MDCSHLRRDFGKVCEFHWITIIYYIKDPSLYQQPRNTVRSYRCVPIHKHSSFTSPRNYPTAATVYYRSHYKKQGKVRLRGPSYSSVHPDCKLHVNIAVVLQSIRLLTALIYFGMKLNSGWAAYWNDGGGSSCVDDMCYDHNRWLTRHAHNSSVNDNSMCCVDVLITASPRQTHRYTLH